ncbi:hypothetical protein ACEU6E_06315 [Halorutilales archaeon Cl-col2-1]
MLKNRTHLLIVIITVIISIWFFIGSSGSHYTIEDLQVSQNPESNLKIDADMVDSNISPNDPAVIKLSMKNRGDREMNVKAGPVPPFGVVYASPESPRIFGIPAWFDNLVSKRGLDGKLLLWNSKYVHSSNVDLVNNSATTIQTVTSIDPNETVSRKYKIKSDTSGLVPGKYTFRRDQSYYLNRSASTLYTSQYKVNFHIEWG